jgi:hypothetical protein
MLGYSREGLLSMRVFDIDADVSPDAWPNIWSALRQVRKSTMEARHRTKDGRAIPVELAGNILLFEGVEYSCASLATSAGASSSSSDCPRARR